MALRRPAVTVDLAALEQSAIVAVRSIESGYSAASKAIMAYVLGAKESNATPAVFEAGIARIADAIPGVAKITVGAYISNARRIFAADKVSLAKAVKEAGTDSIKALAGACPAVSKAKAEGQKARAETKAETKAASDVKAPSAPVVSRAKAEGQKARAETKAETKTETASDAKSPSAPVVTTPATDPLVAANNALVAMRKLAMRKKRSRLILAVIGDVEDLLQEIADLMRAA